MNFEQFIKDLGIDPGAQYSIKEAAAKVKKVPRTVDYWCRYGLRRPRGGILVLGHFYSGGTPIVPGKCLIEFMVKRNEDKEN